MHKLYLIKTSKKWNERNENKSVNTLSIRRILLLNYHWCAFQTQTSAIHVREILKAYAKLETNALLFLILKAYSSLESNVFTLVLFR